MDEEVLVIKRTNLFGEKDETAFTGFKTPSEFKISETAMKSAHFRLRKTTSPNQDKPAEEDADYKQIIPYMILTHKGKIFCFKRTPKGTETRLHNKYSVGLGGHINKIDVNDKKNLIEEGMKREFEEEVKYSGKTKTKILGYINDDSGDVEKVHFAIVYQIELENDEVTLGEEKLTDGKMCTLNEIIEKKEFLENWSKTTMSALEKSNNSLIK